MTDEIKDYQRGWNDENLQRGPRLFDEGADGDCESRAYWRGRADAATLISMHYKRGWRDAVAAAREALEKRFGKE